MSDTYVNAKDAIRRMVPLAQVVVLDALAYIEWVHREVAKGVEVGNFYVYTGRSHQYTGVTGWAPLSTYLKSFESEARTSLLEGEEVDFESALHSAMCTNTYEDQAIFLVPPGVTIGERTALQLRRWVDAGVVNPRVIRSLHFIQEGSAVRAFEAPPLRGLVEVVDDLAATEDIEMFLAKTVHELRLGDRAEPLRVLMHYAQGMNRAQIQAAVTFSFVQTRNGGACRVTGELFNQYRVTKLGWRAV